MNGYWSTRLPWFSSIPMLYTLAAMDGQQPFWFTWLVALYWYFMFALAGHVYDKRPR